MQFRGDGGHTYEIEVKKGPTTTRLGGEGWREFIAVNRLIGDGEFVCFGLMDGVSRITVFYLKTVVAKRKRMKKRKNLLYLHLSPRDANLPLVRMNTSNASCLQAISSLGCHLSPA